METLIGQSSGGPNPAGQSPAGQPLAAPGADGGWIKDSNLQTFMQDVIQTSQQVPVLVDFWAPWCGPCKQLTPILEKLVNAAGGKVRMVKVNVDENPEIAQQLRIQSIPAVFAFKGGQPVDGFMGALPESQVKQFIEQLAGGIGPSPIDQLLEHGLAALEANELDVAQGCFAEILSVEPENAAAAAGMARVLLADGKAEDATRLLDALPPKIQAQADVTGARAAIALAAKAAAAGPLDGLAAAVRDNPEDLQARYDLALGLLADGQNEAAATELLDIVRRNRGWNDEAARRQLVELFEAWGPIDPLTIAVRRQLSSILFA